jgi:nitrite reductase/ring-hydroxylating ferredoxin subunit/uncharacterized membrane protein
MEQRAHNETTPTAQEATMFGALREFINTQGWLDTVGDPLQKALTGFFPQDNPTRKQLQNFLNGVWLGHPLHPMLTDVPVGSWTATLVLDVTASITDDDSMATAADLTLLTGLLAAYSSAATGLTDWMDTYGEERKLGLLHGLTMLATTSMYTLSLLARLSGARSSGVAMANIGYLLLSAGAYLGGDEVYDVGYGVNHTTFQHGPGSFTGVMPEADVPENGLTRGEAGGVPVLLAKVDGRVYALDDTCVHAGCSLAGGSLSGTVVTCPCHGSQYDVRDGRVLNGPATMDEPAYDVQITNGMVEVKQR